MTTEQIELALEDLDMMVENARQNCTMVRFLEVVHSANIIRESLEKQIEFPVFDISDGNGAWKDGYCKCGQYITDGDNYCYNCGQKLNWEEVEED